MDPNNIVIPAAQSLVTEILSDGWTQIRTWLAKHWSCHDKMSQSDLESRLDSANSQGIEISSEQGDSRRAVLEAYWAGYLSALLNEHPQFAHQLHVMMNPSGEPAAPVVSNSVSGTVSGNVVQARTIKGDISFRRVTGLAHE